MLLSLLSLFATSTAMYTCGTNPYAWIWDRNWCIGHCDDMVIPRVFENLDEQMRDDIMRNFAEARRHGRAFDTYFEGPNWEAWPYRHLYGGAGPHSRGANNRALRALLRLGSFTVEQECGWNHRCECIPKWDTLRFKLTANILTSGCYYVVEMIRSTPSSNYYSTTSRRRAVGGMWERYTPGHYYDQVTCEGGWDEGFCMDHQHDQNHGVIKVVELTGLDFSTTEAQDLCMVACMNVDESEGCEVIWGQGNHGCYVHTKRVTHANGAKNHRCAIFRGQNRRRLTETSRLLKPALGSTTEVAAIDSSTEVSAMDSAEIATPAPLSESSGDVKVKAISESSQDVKVNA